MPHPLSDDVERLANQMAHSFGLSVVAVHLLAHRIPMTVQVMVRAADGADVTLDACAAFSGPLGEALESSGLIETAYMLEVSSPGIGEQLLTDRDFLSFRGFPVAVHRRDAAGAEAVREGLLMGRDAEAVTLNVRGRPLRIPRVEVVRVRFTTPSADT